jgi:lysophospholipid acyltransferase (LPLAT)-like uncharacterized protein
MNFVKNFFRKIRNTKIINFFELNFFSFFAWLVIQLVSRTLKIKQINFNKIKSLEKNVIYAFFHGEQFILVFTHKWQNVGIMTSYSPDGELQTRILKKFGYDIVRGSTSKKGATSGTLGLLDKISKGQNIAVAVDGPHGPGFKVKPGVIFLAQKTALPIIPVRVVAKNAIKLNNWDKYIIPLPFSMVYIIYGEPFYVKEHDNIKNKILELEKIMHNLTNQLNGKNYKL